MKERATSRRRWRIGELADIGRMLDDACAHADRDVEPDDVLATIEAMSRVVRKGEARVAGAAPQRLDGLTTLRPWLRHLQAGALPRPLNALRHSPVDPSTQPC